MPINNAHASVLFVTPRFLTPPECRSIRRAMSAGLTEPAEVLEDDFEEQADVRRASSIEVDPGVLAAVERRIEEARGPLASFFGTTVGRREGVNFLRYAPGGFYRPHRDRGTTPAWPGAARRRIAVVLFLNSSREAAGGGEFTGGVLRLYPGDEAVDVHPEEGLLVAFPADVLHEVTVVRDGTRDTVVDWFY